MQPKILVFAGSIRTGAFSGMVANAAARELALQGAEVSRISLADYALPIYDGDLEREQGIPVHAMRLGRLIAAHDGLLIATPEYNHSLPPLLKNTIDWISRIRTDGGKPFRPLRGRATALCSSSDGRFAGIRAANHLRAVCVAVGLEVISTQSPVASGAEAFDASGMLRNERDQKSLERTCRALCEHAALLSGNLKREP